MLLRKIINTYHVAYSEYQIISLSLEEKEMELRIHVWNKHKKRWFRKLLRLQAVSTTKFAGKSQRIVLSVLNILICQASQKFENKPKYPATFFFLPLFLIGSHKSGWSTIYVLRNVMHVHALALFKSHIHKRRLLVKWVFPWPLCLWFLFPVATVTMTIIEIIYVTIVKLFSFFLADERDVGWNITVAISLLFQLTAGVKRQVRK